jgi:hypothetical protein
MSGHRDSDRIGAAISTAAQTVRAPVGLRERIEEEGRSAQAPRRAGLGRLLVPAAGVAAVAAAALAVLLLGGGSPTIAETAAAALRAPTEPAPATDPADDQLVQASIGGIQFPNYTWWEKDWRTVGARRDELSGRDSLTLTYRGRDGRIGYTIVDGEPLEVPSGARRIEAKGKRLAAFRRDGATILTWRQNGHTCVLASRELGVRQLVAFATWS